MVDVIDAVLDLSVASIGGVIVKSMVDAGNYSGIAGTIAGLFVFLVLAIAGLGALMKLRHSKK